MVSIIIASANESLLQEVQQNIANTIGIEHELLVFPNADGKRGICDIYNEGIEKAKYPIRCFMHEDIAFHTIGWGKIVENIFEQHPSVGIVGIAGSTYKSLMPIGWPNQATQQSERSHLIQSFKYLNLPQQHFCLNPFNEVLAKVVVADGAWLCIKKEVTDRFRFDSKTFRHFHCYDLDYCLTAGKAYDVAITYEVLLHHFSDGNLDEKWMEEQLLFFRKWEQELPASTEPLSLQKLRSYEKQNFRYWVKLLRRLKFKKTIAFYLLYRPKVRKVLGLKYFLKLHYTIWRYYTFR